MIKTLTLVTILFFSLTSCQTLENPQKINKLTIVTSFYPLTYFTQKIGENKIEVINLVKNQKVHDYVPTSSDLILLQKADLFIYHGLNMEPWTTNIIPLLNQNKQLKITQELYITKNYNEDSINTKHKNEHSINPHTWLDITLSKEMMSVITKKLSTLDPKNKIYYEQNAEKLEQKLSELDEKYRNKFTSCQKSDVIISHDAFPYLAKSYQFKTHSIIPKMSHSEPSAKDLENIIKIILEKDLHFILSDKADDNSFTETIAKETNIQILPINTLEQFAKTKNQDFLYITENNIKQFLIALECDI